MCSNARCALVAATLAVAACGGSTAGNTTEVCSDLTQTEATPQPQWAAGTVFTIVMENKSLGQIQGNPDAPYLNQLIADGALAQGYHDPYIHPSEPNYIWMIAGENFGVLDDQDPAAHSIDSTSHIADQIELAGLDWKSYQESMGEPCGIKSHGSYAAKHDPFVYFSDINGWDGTKFQPSQRCIDHVVDYSVLDQDLAAGTVPNYVFITPNLDNDMHDGSIARGDQWLAAQLPKIFASDAYKNGGVVFVLWDEGSSNADDPPFIAISPNAKKGFVSTVSYDTTSYLKTVQQLLGLEELPCVADKSAVSAMDDLFMMPLDAPVALP
jgi:phospholipase C